jgi:glycosyltransferase involved in cell wall biosynthesis
VHILFLTLAYPLTGQNIYTDLVDGFIEQGNRVTVLRQDETRTKGALLLNYRKNVCILSIPTGKLLRTNLIKKGLNTLLLESRFIKKLKQIDFSTIDVLIYSTPPITFQKVIVVLKKKYSCIAYLLLKDIFPQNAVDMGMIRKRSLVYLLFRSKEKKLYQYSDIIGCMSPANVDYLLSHNPELVSKQIHIAPNCIFPSRSSLKIKKIELYNKYGIPSDSIQFIYGGNLGKPQGIDFLICCINELQYDNSIFFTIVGNGTEYDKLSHFIKNNNIKNTKLFTFLSKEQYFELLSCMDIGLVFLDNRFTIPNFPSRVLDYMNYFMPIVACTDKICDIKQEICDQGAGFWCESKDTKSFIEIIEKIKNNKEEICSSMGKKSRELLIEKYAVSTVVLKIQKEINLVKY